MFTLTNLLLAVVLMSVWLAAAAVARSVCKTLKIAQPGMASAMFLTLVAVGGALASQFAVGTMMGMSVAGMSAEPATMDQMKLLLAMPIWMLVCATVYRVMIPATFGKAMVLFIAQAIAACAIVFSVNLLANVTQQANLVAVCDLLSL